MAEAGRLTLPRTAPRRLLQPVTLLRLAIIAAVLVCWEALARSGLLYQDVVPSLFAIAKALLVALSEPMIACQSDLAVGPIVLRWSIPEPEFFCHLGRTLYEIGLGLAIGGLTGLLAGILLGGNALLRRAFEPLIYYLGPTPKIIFFPVMIMWFGVGPPSKIAMGAISCFFPIALNVAAGMRQIEPVLIRVGRSFRASGWQMTTKIYLPAMRHPVINGVRIGLGVAVIGTLLAETKLSNRGVGFLVNQAYSLFKMPQLYALLILLFVLSIGANALIGRLGGLDRIRQP
jgi:ABC-type nitrate/sulfonate/bicarbonate transport system permease component